MADMHMDYELTVLVMRSKLRPDMWPESRIKRWVRHCKGGVERDTWRRFLDNPAADEIGLSYPR